MAERNETFIATIKVNNEQAKAKVAELEKEIEKKNNRLRELAGKRSKAAKEETAHIRAELKIFNAEYRERRDYPYAYHLSDAYGIHGPLRALLPHRNDVRRNKQIFNLLWITEKWSATFRKKSTPF